MYSFSYDVTHILRHLRFEKAWEIFKEEKYDKDRAEAAQSTFTHILRRAFRRICDEIPQSKTTRHMEIARP